MSVPARPAAAGLPPGTTPRRDGGAARRSAATGVPSPCINVCRLDAAGRVCIGCRRTIDEIAAWGTMSDADKWVVWRRLAPSGAPAGSATPAKEPR